MTTSLLVADLFCGAGGSSTGAEKAIDALGLKMVLVCVNHWPVAIETHRKNHPTARHYLEDVSVAKPQQLVPEGYLDLLMASPECTHFSRARGGKPVNDQSRMNPWAIIRWLTDLNVRCLLVENVPEFIDWGPVDKKGHPILDKKGVYFGAWIKTMWELGYRPEWRVLNAADYGDATTRKRFFLIARKDGIPVRWPEPSYSRTGAKTMQGRLPRWKAAKEIIDWNKPGRSLLDDPKYHKRPLSINTRRRIARGLEKYGGMFAPLYINLLELEAEKSKVSGNPAAFTIQNRKNGRARSMDEPVSTVTASNGGGGLCKVDPTLEPFILGQQSCSAPRGTDKPIMTITADGAISLIDPQLVVFHGCSGTKPVDEPVPSLPTKSHIGLVDPQLISYYGNSYQDTDVRPVEEPVPTVTTKGRFGLVEPTAEPFQVTTRFSNAPRSINEPVPTNTNRKLINLVEPVMVQVNHGDNSHENRIQPVDEPLPTVTTHRNVGVAEPVLKRADGSEVDPRRLVLVDGVPHILDIRFRMLNNRELARAMGFDDAENEYEFVGNVAEVTKQIGNAVPVHMAAALVKAILEDK
jgi:DNA (cytosine-5)-methyltransferase 1